MSSSCQISTPESGECIVHDFFFTDGDQEDGADSVPRIQAMHLLRGGVPRRLLALFGASPIIAEEAFV